MTFERHNNRRRGAISLR